MNALEKCVDMLIVIIIFFLLPLLFYGENTRMLHSMSAGAACESFLKRVSTSGEITLPVWKELEDLLEQFNCKKYEVQRTYTLWEPGTEIDSVVERCYSEEKETLVERIRTEGTVKLHKGDRLRVTFYIDEFPTVYYDVVRSEGNAE